MHRTPRAVALLTLGALALAGCVTQTPPTLLQDDGRTTPQKIAPRPDYPGYGAAIGRQAIPWSVESLVEDFVDLQFKTEWGSGHEQLLRWPGPVTVGMVGPELDAYRPDVADLLARLNQDAPTLDISLANAGPGDITIRTAPKSEMREIAETALCFFAPVALDWEGYKAANARGDGGWDGIRKLENITIFIPEHAAPHVFRICFVEEIMQALGPGNDLYRLEDSGFNDDEVHVAPTAFDFLMLRTLYHPSLRPGMSQPEARAAARKVLTNELAKTGEASTRIPRKRTDHDQEYQLYHYFSDVRRDPDERRELLDLANEAAAKLDENDHRIGEALRSEAYFASEREQSVRAVDFAERAVAHFEQTLPEGSARLARSRADLGLFLLLNRQYDEAIDVLSAAEPWLAAHGKEDDLASSMRLRAIALAQVGEFDDAADAARDALAWAAFVYGADSLALSSWRKQFRDFDISI